ncbi:transposase [Microbacterium terregens]|uniref:Transposase n=1 Tax=Microbacterium terregens TaxID=69363 RepID=A0ABV5SYR7_9MICO
MPAAHPPEFRRRALDLVAQGNPVSQTARDLGISESCLRNWMNRDAVDTGRKPGLTTDEHKELVELRRRNRVLETEIEITKRASAYFASENVLPEWGSGWSRSLPPTVSPFAVACRSLNISTSDYYD